MTACHLPKMKDKSTDDGYSTFTIRKSRQNPPQCGFWIRKRKVSDKSQKNFGKIADKSGETLFSTDAIYKYFEIRVSSFIKYAGCSIA